MTSGTSHLGTRARPASSAHFSRFFHESYPAAAQLDMSASVLEIATAEAHGALRANEVVESSALVGITARVIGSRSCRPWLPPSGAG